MPYSELIRQENEYTYSVNIQFDIENDTKLSRFIPNETTIKLLREYFNDIVRPQSNNHARILYGSYGTGKSHFLTVLSQILNKSFARTPAFDTFIARVRDYDDGLANDIVSYVQTDRNKPYLVVPIVFDFEDFNRCIYFSLKKKLDSIGVKISYKTFYSQAEELLSLWKENDESARRLEEIAATEHIDIESLEKMLDAIDPKAEKLFNSLFAKMTFGVKYVYEVSNLMETLNQANTAISNQYSGLIFIFDEFGRYIEDNVRKIRVKDIQDLAEYCDHSEKRNHIILVSHKEISQYTKRHGKSLAVEWKKVEGRYKADSINNKQDQCLSLVRSILIKREPTWQLFRDRYAQQLNQIYSDAMDFKGFLVNVAADNNPFEGGFPLHPIALFALDRLSKKVAQNDRTFFTYLASREENSLYRFLISHELDEFHFVGISDIYDYFEPSIKAAQSDDSFEWYKNLQTALAKNHSDPYENSPEVKILKVIATIGLINDPGALVADSHTIASTIDCPSEVVENALDSLCQRKIIKYSGTYGRYEFFDASIFDVETIIEEESTNIGEETTIKSLNDNFVDFVLYPSIYNRVYKISRVFVPVFARVDELAKKPFLNRLGNYYDGVLVMVVGNADTDVNEVATISEGLSRSIIWVNKECSRLTRSIKKYIAVQYIDTQKSKYIEKDPAFEKELQYYKNEIVSDIRSIIAEWKKFMAETYIVSQGRVMEGFNSIHQVARLASDMMFEVYPQTLLVNNELINKNTISGTITAAKKKALRSIIAGSSEATYYDLQYLSPEYIAIRSVLAKNGFINAENCENQNALPDGSMPQDAIRRLLAKTLERAQKGNVDFSEIYAQLKQPPYGLRDGYLSLLFATMLAPYQKSLIISSHGTEQELSAELFEEIVKRPHDFVFTVADWDADQLGFVDQLEKLFDTFLDSALLSKNRLKAIYEAMMSHYKNVSKFARTTDEYVSDATKAYRKMLDHSYDSYTKFFFNTAKTLAGDYFASFELIKNSRNELESSIQKLCRVLKNYICDVLNVVDDQPLASVLRAEYHGGWKEKHRKAFDYYTNTFLDFVANASDESNDCDIIFRLGKSLTGIEINYWSDRHIDDFKSRFSEVITKLKEYSVSDQLQENETKMTLSFASGGEKTIVFDATELSDVGTIIKNKINATFSNFGLAVTYDDKVQILLSLIDDLLEGR